MAPLAGIVRSQLQALDVELYSRFHVIEQKAKSLLEYSQGGAHIFYTTHGYSHISRVEQNYDWLLSVDDLATFTRKELFCLLVATYFHDAFMIPPRAGEENKARNAHATEASKYLREHADTISIDVHEATCIGEIIKGHHVKSFDDIAPETVLGSDLVDQRKLAACLSVADICHADASRAPRILVEYLDLDPESHWHWRRHLQIGGVARKNDKILVSGTIFSDDGDKALKAYCDDIRLQLEIVKPYFRSVLLPISDVELLLNRASSPVERPLVFQADMSKLLDLLINSVYSDRNVFIREVIQNSLDACRIRSAIECSNVSSAYAPQIICTALFNKGDIIPWGIRVDDNGVGMSINDFEDTVLWLGRSISTDEGIAELLETGRMTNLIGVFGIGIMSCFGVAEEITISSSKKNSQPFRVMIKSVFDHILPSQDADNTLGSTIIVRFQKNIKLSLHAIMDKYFWNINSAVIRFGEDICTQDSAISRREAFERYGHFELLRHNVALVPSGKKEFYFTQNFPDGQLFLWHDSNELVGREHIGDITVLSEGIYVCDTKSDKILPKCIAFVSGAIDIAASKIDLAASRENFIQNKKLDILKGEVSPLLGSVVRDLVVKSNEEEETDHLHRYLLSEIFVRLEPAEREMFYENITKYLVRISTSETISLHDCLEEDVIYLYQPAGRFVSPVCDFNGEAFFKQRNDLQEIARYSLEGQGFIVIEARILKEEEIIFREEEAKEFKDDRLITGFLGYHGIEVIDISKDYAEESEIKSLPVSADVRKLVGSGVKFVDFGSQMEHPSLFALGTLYLNIRSQPVAELMRSLDLNVGSSTAEHLTKMFVLLHSREFDALENYILESIKRGS
jgi:hypothetical protein